MNFIERCDKWIEDFAYDHPTMFLAGCGVTGVVIGLLLTAATIPLYKLFDKIFGTNLYEKYFG